MKKILHEYSVLIVGGAISLVLALAVGFLLFRTSRQYRTIASDLSSETRQLDELHHRSPYPNEGNVQKAHENLGQLQQGYTQMLEEISSGQRDLPTIEPPQWPLFRQQVYGPLNEEALRSNVILPDRFSYGFDRYALGRLPEPRHLPRLVRQAGFIEKMFRILLDAKIHAVTRVDRHIFEDDAAPDDDPWGAEPITRGRGRRTRETAHASAEALRPGFYEHPDGLYTRERMVFSFAVRESALWQILNALSQSDVFCVVSRLQVSNPTFRSGSATDPRTPTRRTSRASADPRWSEEFAGELGADPRRFPSAAERRPGFPPEGPLPREERIIAGRDELLNVELEIDFYHFREDDREQEARL